MAKKELVVKKRNSPDATARNVRADRKEHKEFERRLENLEMDMAELFERMGGLFSRP